MSNYRSAESYRNEADDCLAEAERITESGRLVDGRANYLIARAQVLATLALDAPSIESIDVAQLDQSADEDSPNATEEVQP